MKVLWLPAWYPNQINPYDGDFIQRHAKATSIYQHVQVIHVIRDKEGVITKTSKEIDSHTENLHEKIIYYHTPISTISIIDKLVSTWQYKKLYQQAIKNFIKKEGIPFCTHVHVIDKNGWVSLWVKRKYNTALVISEHWTVYLPNALPNFKNFNWLFKIIWKKIISSSKAISVVSNNLGEAIQKIQKNITYTVIPNVVDSTIFFPVEKEKTSIFQFIHVSTLGYQKNIEAILEAFAIVKETNIKFKLSVFGPKNAAVEALTVQLKIYDHVVFYNEIPQQQLAKYIQQSHALILYSRYETFGCVLIEANACGIPAIISDIPVFHEIVKEGVNGYFVQEDNATALAKKLLWFMENAPVILPKPMSNATIEKYNYMAIGKLFSEWYASFTI